MPDGVQLNVGVGGALIDTETNAARGNAQMQRVKLVLGGPDLDGGNVSAANPLPAQLTGNLPNFATPPTVNIATLPALPAGANVIGSVVQSGAWNIGRTWALSSGTDSVTATIAGTPAVAQSGSWNVTANAGTGTFAISAASLPLPASAAKDSTLQSILAAIQAMTDISGSVWYDPTTAPPTYYIRRETVNEATGVVTVAWFTPGGGGASPTIANLVAIANSQNIATETTVYTATSSGSGYATGDVLIHTFGVDTALATPALSYSFWLNAGPSATGVMASAPAGGTYAQTTGAVSVASLPLPPNAAQETGGNLATVAAAQGAGGTGIAAPTGGSGILGWLSGIYQAVTGTLAATIGLNRVLPTPWTAGVQLDARLYSGVEVEISPGGGTATVAFTRSLLPSDPAPQPLAVYDQNAAGPYTTVSTSTPVIVSLPGGGYLPAPTITGTATLTYRMEA